MKCVASYSNIYFLLRAGSVTFYIFYLKQVIAINFNFFICKMNLIIIFALINTKGYGKNELIFIVKELYQLESIIQI